MSIYESIYVYNEKLFVWVGVWYSPFAIPIPNPKNASNVDPNIMIPENCIPLSLVIWGNLDTCILISFSIPLYHIIHNPLWCLLLRPLNSRISIKQLHGPLVNLLLTQWTASVTVLPCGFIVLFEGFDLFSTESHVLSLQQRSIASQAQRSRKHLLSCFLH